MKEAFLRRVAAVFSAVGMVTLTSCGSRVELMSSEASNQSFWPTDVSSATESNTATENNTSEPVTEPFSLDVSVPEGYKLPDSYVIDGFKSILQKPELPTGCEVTALCEVLNYLGFGIDKVELADEFMPMDNNGLSTMYHAYIGDPKVEEGFGCYSPVIVQTANDYFQSLDSPCYAVDLTGTELNDLFFQVAEGRPVIAWSTIALIISYPNFRWTTWEGEEMWFNDFQHCVAIYGFDCNANTVHVADPLAGNVTYDIDRFKAAYELMGKQAVVICGDSSTAGKYRPIEGAPHSEILSRNKQEQE
ncbi:MAG: C39 family peptidase [Ruminococcus sp.]|nr:C39 family peptidase [Ruminococcus sp.]